MPRTRSVAFPWLNPLLRLVVRFRLVWIIFLASLMLSGCVRYDAGVTFRSPTQGEIVQHIQLNSSLAAVNGRTAQQWFNNLERRARQLEGRVQRLSAQELVVTIPFQNGADLVARFNQFFSPAEGDAQFTTLDPLPELKSTLQLHQSNLLLFQRDRLTYDLDLTALGVRGTDGRLIANPASLINLEFTLQTPWGARAVGGTAPLRQTAQQVTWALQPGQVNHLEAVFWLPDLLGWGTVAIALFCAAGFYWKSRSQQTIPTKLTLG